MVQQCAGLAGRRPHGKASVISVGSYNESSYLEKIFHLGGLPTNFEDIHKRKKPSFDQLPDGCFSLSGQYTISHKTRKSRGLVFTTTNKESKSSGLNRLDEMSFEDIFLYTLMTISMLQTQTIFKRLQWNLNNELALRLVDIIFRWTPKERIELGGEVAH